MNQLKNRVQLIGNLGKDPEVRRLQDNKIVAQFPLATSETYKNSKGEKVEETQWHQVVIWGRLAEIVEKYLQKGNQVAIEGRLTHRSYDDKDGIKRYVTEVIATDLLMLGKKNDEPVAEKEVAENDLPF